MAALAPYLTAAGRALLSIIFIWAGYEKLTGFSGSQAYMAKFGVPGQLLPLVILTELGGGLAILLGWKTKYVAIALAGFTLLAALIFHTDFASKTQLIMFIKNLAISGGFLVLAASGPGACSLDGRKG